MNSQWVSFVPSELTFAPNHSLGLKSSFLTNQNSPNLIGHTLHFTAAVLFADVSGFTVMSEALAKTGKAGAEKLTTILNSYFEPMIALINSFGGIVGKFGGDALTVLFPYTPESQQQVAQKAIQCALSMQAQMSRYQEIKTEDGTFSLTMKAGLAASAILYTNVGGGQPLRIEYVIAGEALDLCAEAEHHATKGEVVVECNLLSAAFPFNEASVADQIEIIEEREEGKFVCVGQLKNEVQSQPCAPQFSIEADSEENLEILVTPFLHPRLAQLIKQGQGGFINEHRPVTILFVSFSGYDYDCDPEVDAKLQAFFAEGLTTISRYDGYLNKIDMGDKGSKFIVLFGAPVAHEDDADRALLCSVELMQVAKNHVSSLKIGVNSGFVYSGLVGSGLRQEYTVMGDAVNLAARMMQAAQPNQILVTGFTQSQASDSFDWQPLPPIMVKGKSEPISIYTLTGQLKEETLITNNLHLQEPDYLLPMVGRQKELQIVEERFEDIRQGRGQIIGVTAEAGMGKSRLAAEIIARATERQLKCIGSECLSYATSTPYLVWHNVWRTILELDKFSDLAAQTHYLEEFLGQIDPHFPERLPLLGPALNLNLPDNSLTRAMEGRTRKAMLEAMLVEILRYKANANAQPLLIVLEDCHWIDQLSQELLQIVARNIAELKVLLVLIYRPVDVASEAHLRTGLFEQMRHFTQLRLTEFTSEEAAQLIELKLRQLFGANYLLDDENMTALVERLTSKAQGNPFYIDEMVNLLQDKGIDPNDSAALAELELPDSLYNLIISRIDQLGENEKITVKVASVIGRLFRASWLWGIYAELGEPAEVLARLKRLSQLELTSQDRPEPELEYLFKHVVTQEVAYSSLAVATRTELHANVGGLVEKLYAGKLDQYFDLLAYHYGRSDNIDKQREYFRVAGETAQNKYANAAAIDYYQRLLPLLDEAEQPPILLKLGEVFQLIGKWGDAEELYSNGLTIAESVADTLSLARSQRALGFLLYQKGNFDRALQLLEQARQNFESLNDQEGISHAIGNMGLVYARQGEYEKALEHYQRQLQIANAINFQTGASAAIGNIGIVYNERGEYDKALEYYQQKLELDTAIGKLQGVSIAIGNIAVIYSEQGKYSQALTYFQRKLQLDSEIGNHQSAGAILVNVGAVYFEQGYYKEALTCYLQTLQFALELNEQRLVAFGTIKIADVFAKIQNLKQARRCYTLAINLCSKLKLANNLCEVLYGTALLNETSEIYDEAQKLNSEALELANQLGIVEIEFKAKLLAEVLKAKIGQISKIELEKYLRAWLEDLTDQIEQAALYYTLWTFEPFNQDYRDCAAELYQHLYSRAPKIEYYRRYSELTGNKLASPPLLPAPPDLTKGHLPDLEDLLARLETAAN